MAEDGKVYSPRAWHQIAPAILAALRVLHLRSTSRLEALHDHVAVPGFDYGSRSVRPCLRSFATQSPQDPATATAWSTCLPRGVLAEKCLCLFSLLASGVTELKTSIHDAELTSEGECRCSDSKDLESVRLDRLQDYLPSANLVSGLSLVAGCSIDRNVWPDYWGSPADIRGRE